MTALIIALSLFATFYAYCLCVMAKRGDRAFENRP